jgi:peroxiredoxin Q/BCP
MPSIPLFRTSLRLSVAAALSVSLITGVRADPPEVGQTAPNFTLPDQNGKLHTLSDYRGKTVILAFFPKADTPG